MNTLGHGQDTSQIRPGSGNRPRANLLGSCIAFAALSGITAMPGAALAQNAAPPLAGSSSGSNTGTGVGPGAGMGAGAGAPAGAGLGSGSDASSDSGSDTGGPPTPPPVADTVLPRVGIDDNLPDLRDHLLDAFGTPATPERSGQLPQSGLQITKQIGVSEEFTDNAGRFAGGGGSGYDFITLIQPQVTITDATQRIQLNLNYAPTGEIYARNTGYSQFEQDASGDVLATVLPNWLFVDLRGSISQQSVYGGFGPSTTATLAPGDRETLSTASISPYMAHTFGTAGTAQVGGAYIYSATDAPGSAQGFNNSAPLGFGGNYGSSYLGTERAFANFTTGEDLGRLRDRIGTDDNFYSGSGALRDAHRITVTDDASYAITRRVALLGQVGYEDLAYPASDFNYSGPTGAGGVRLTPNRGSSLTVEYRYIDGFGSVFVQGSVQATPRIRIFGGYSEGISTQQQDQQDTLLAGENDATGALASATLGVPLLGNSNAFGTNQDLQRLRRLDATITYLGDRDTISLSLQREQTDPVGRQLPGIFNAPTSGTFGNLSWTRQLTPRTSVTGNLQYGSSRNAVFIGNSQASTNDTIAYSLGLNHNLSDTLSIYGRVGGNYVLSGYGNYGGESGNENDLIIGAVKKF